MKNTLLILLTFISIESFSQITLEFQTQNHPLTIIKLSNSESKYFVNDWINIYNNNQFSLDNLDGTYYKTIQLPPKPDSLSSIGWLCYITNSLFDNDPSTIEYLAYYFCDSTLSGFWSQVKIIREDGTILLDEPGATFGLPSDFIDNIYNTEEGPKLKLDYYHYGSGIPYQTKVFNIPGELPTSTEMITSSNGSMTLYPNPNNGSFLIEQQSIEGIINTIDLYSINGKLIDTFRSGDKIININKSGLPDGTYLLQSRAKNVNCTSKVIIKK